MSKITCRRLPKACLNLVLAPVLVGVLGWFLGGCSAPPPPANPSPQSSPSPGDIRVKLNKKIHVLPLAYSAESRNRFPEVIAQFESAGLGNAVWQEVEKVLFNQGGCQVITMPYSEKEYLGLVQAHRPEDNNANPSSNNRLFELPDYALVLNCNFFKGENRALRGVTESVQTYYDMTIHYRLYALKQGRFNQPDAIDSGSARADSPMLASQRAAQDAMNKLILKLTELSQ